MSQINITGVKYNQRFLKEDMETGQSLDVKGDGKVEEPIFAAIQDTVEQGIGSFEDSRLKDLALQLQTMKNSSSGLGLGQNSPEIEQFVAKDTLGDEWKALGNGQFSNGSPSNHQVLNLSGGEASLTTRAELGKEKAVHSMTAPLNFAGRPQVEKVVESAQLGSASRIILLDS